MSKKQRIETPVATFVQSATDAFGVSTTTHRVFRGGRVESRNVGNGEFGAWDVSENLSYDAYCLPSLLRRYRREGWQEAA